VGLHTAQSPSTLRRSCKHFETTCLQRDFIFGYPLFWNFKTFCIVKKYYKIAFDISRCHIIYTARDNAKSLYIYGYATHSFSCRAVYAAITYFPTIRILLAVPDILPKAKYFAFWFSTSQGAWIGNRFKSMITGFVSSAALLLQSAESASLSQSFLVCLLQNILTGKLCLQVSTHNDT
jgi:hypothetical protein